ncbi:hypothetical protein NP493_311g01005, partial [Ridgeia piscesae]
KEFKLLHERDDVLREREVAVTEREVSLKEKESVLKKAAAKIEKHIDMETTRQLQAAEELDALQTQHGKLERQFTSLQARLTNLQRKRNFEETKHSGQQALATLRKQTATKDTAKSATSRQKKGGVTVSLRRLGEELYRPAKQAQGGGDNSRDIAYIQSNDPQVRFLSALIILKTDTQVDHLAHVSGTLKSELKTDGGKDMFLYYQATSTLLTHVKTTNKLMVNLVTDIYLQMAIESPLLPSFLASCSNEAWFRSVSLVWRMPSVDVKLLEKLSIILQKLSKMNSCSEMLRTMGNENPFLVLNVKSILFNLGCEKVSTMSL